LNNASLHQPLKKEVKPFSNALLVRFGKGRHRFDQLFERKSRHKGLSFLGEQETMTASVLGVNLPTHIAFAFQQGQSYANRGLLDP